MSAPWVWAELDLERTTELSLIRRAYARRLKIVHPEDNGPGFQRLREAYDLALAYAARAPFDIAVPQAPPEPPLEAPAPIRSPADSGRDLDAPAEAEPAPSDPIARLNADIQRLVALLSTRGDPDSLVRVFGEIVDSPALENLGVETQTETALADLIARTRPGSDALIEPAVGRFGWRSDDGARPPSPAVAFILRRRLELEHEARLRRLETSLTTQGATSDATSQALADVLNSPALQDLGIYSRTETWIAGLIARNTPQSDPLVAHVVRRFGWTAERTDVAGIQMVLGRLNGLSRVKARAVRAVPRLGLRAWYVIAFFAIVVLTAVFRDVGQDRTIHLSPAPPDVVAAGPGRVVATCQVNAKHGLSGCGVNDGVSAAPGLRARAIDFLQRRVTLPSASVPVGAQYLATLDFDAEPGHDPKLSLNSAQANAPPSALRQARLVSAVSGQVVLTCQVSQRRGLAGCAVVTETPRNNGLGYQAMSLAGRDEGWLTKPAIGTETRVYVTFTRGRAPRLRATWKAPAQRTIETPAQVNAEPIVPPAPLAPKLIYSDPQAAPVIPPR